MIGINPMTKFRYDSLKFAKMFTLPINAKRENFAFFDSTVFSRLNAGPRLNAGLEKTSGQNTIKHRSVRVRVVFMKHFLSFFFFLCSLSVIEIARIPPNLRAFS